MRVDLAAAPFKDAERFFDCVAAVPQERDEKQRLAATPLRMTGLLGGERDRVWADEAREIFAEDAGAKGTLPYESRSRPPLRSKTQRDSSTA